MRGLGVIAVAAVAAVLAAGSWVVVFDSPVRWAAVALGGGVGGLLGAGRKASAGQLGEGCWIGIVMAVVLLVSMPWLRYPFAFQGMLAAVLGLGLGLMLSRLRREIAQGKSS